MSDAAADSAPSAEEQAKAKALSERKRALRKAREEQKRKQSEMQVNFDMSKNQVKAIPKRSKKDVPEQEPLVAAIAGYTIVREGPRVAAAVPAAPPPLPVASGSVATPQTAPAPKLRSAVLSHRDLPSALDSMFRRADPYYRFKIAGVAAAFAGVVVYQYAPTVALALNPDLK
jgi:hypothetical protein